MKRNILLDLDGTLLDSKLGIMRCVNHALQEMGRPTQADGRLVQMIGPPLAQGFPALLGTSEPAVVAEAIAIYRERYDRIGIFESELFDGIKEMLTALSGQGRRLYLVTAKPRPYAVRLLHYFEVQSKFRDIYAPTLKDERDGKAHLIRELLDTDELEAGETVMIGDRDRDIHGGRDNQITSIGVLWGYGSPEELTASGANKLVHAPRELPDLLSSLDICSGDLS